MNIVNKYFCLDARDLQKIVDTNSVQTTITSPPYFDVKNYGQHFSQIGSNQKYSDYLSSIKVIFKKCFEATTNSGTLWVVVNTYKRAKRLKLLPFDIVNALEEIGWIPQDVIIWDKVKNLPYSSRGQFRNNFEYIILFSKTHEFKYYIDRIRETDTLTKWWLKYPERYNPKGKVPENIWRIPIPSQGSWGNGAIRHLCPFPPELIERILLLSTDEEDLVLDPFAGSGVVLAQAKCMKRNFIGCDIYQDYIDRFYSKVLPEIEHKCEQREELKNVKITMQYDLQKYVYALRKLKFGKVILQKLVGEFSRNDWELIILDSEDNNLATFVLILVVRQDVNIDEVEKKISKHITVKPLSKFGLSPTLMMVNREKIHEYIKYDEYSLYLNGIFYEKAENVSVFDVLNSENYEFPPIISDISISRKFIENSSLSYPSY